MRKTKGDLNMKVDLKDLAAAFAQSDVRQGYVDIRAGKVVMMADDMAEEEAMHHAFAMEEDWEHYIPIPNVMDEDETAMMRAFAESRLREDVKERLLTALQGAGAVTLPPSGPPSAAQAGLGGLQAGLSDAGRPRLV